MFGPFFIEGYAIVSGDGMLADASGAMPDEIKFKADQDYFQSGLDRAAAVIQGRHSHEGGPRADGRRRLVATRQIASLAHDPVNPNALLWNPAGMSLEDALRQLGVTRRPPARVGAIQAKHNPMNGNANRRGKFANAIRAKVTATAASPTAVLARPARCCAGAG